MLCLTMQPNTYVEVGEARIRHTGAQPVKLVIDAPKHVKVRRQSLVERDEKKESA